MPSPIPRRLRGGQRFVTLPKNLLLNSGTLLEGFEAAADWMPAAGAGADNTTQFVQGSGSVKATTDSGATETLVKTVAWDLSTMQQLRMQFYLHDLAATYGGHLHIHLSDHANLDRYWRIYTLGSVLKTVGWHQIAYPKNWFGAIGGSAAWASIIRARFQVQAASGQTPSVSFDNLLTGVVGAPFVIITFDDGYLSQYNICYQYMRSHGIRGTLYCRTSVPNAATTLTYAHLREMDGSGWTIGNHTRDHNSLGGETQANQETYIGQGASDLVANGLARGAGHLAYPAGSYDDNSLLACTAQSVLTARTTNGCDRQQSNPMPPTILPPSFGWHELGCTPINNAAPTLTQAKAMIDDAITGGVGITMLFHDVGTAGAGNCTEANFKAIIDYIVSKQGQITPITMADYYALQAGPLSVPVPY